MQDKKNIQEETWHDAVSAPCQGSFCTEKTGDFWEAGRTAITHSFPFSRKINERAFVHFTIRLRPTGGVGI